MAYIGPRPSDGDRITQPSKQVITGNDVLATFALTSIVGNVNDLEVFINNVQQEPIEAYNIDNTGSNIVFTEAILSTDDCYIINRGKAIVYKKGNVEISSGTINNTVIGNTTPEAGSFTVLDATTNLKVPVGDVAARPAAPTDGMIRYNNEFGTYEGYNNGAWGSLGGGATGGLNDKVFIENEVTVTESYTLTAGNSASSVGPITIGDTATVTVPDGSRWVIL